MDEKIMPEISVIICTHNPRMDYLERVLVGLRGQSFPLLRWELLIIDNKSEEPLAGRLDLGWHPQARVVREEELGLTRARLRGIKESRGGLVVFVDDDNVLDNDYLKAAMDISIKHPNLGAWSGQVLPEFEIEPPQEIVPFLGVLCIREISKDIWGNSANPAFLPFGAGMCVRRDVLLKYERDLLNNSARILLGRRGNSLVSSEDLDMGLCCINMGFGTGLFKNLLITHLIPKRRLSREYILKLIEDSACGQVIMEREHGLSAAKSISRIDKLVEGYKFLLASPMQKAVAAARERGAKRAASKL
jgi:glycosyltransferase involved in cell wall biosynthesis